MNYYVEGGRVRSGHDRHARARGKVDEAKRTKNKYVGVHGKMARPTSADQRAVRPGAKRVIGGAAEAALGDGALEAVILVLQMVNDISQHITVVQGRLGLERF